MLNHEKLYQHLVGAELFIPHYSLKEACQLDTALGHRFWCILCFLLGRKWRDKKVWKVQRDKSSH